MAHSPKGSGPDKDKRAADAEPVKDGRARNMEPAKGGRAMDAEHAGDGKARFEGRPRDNVRRAMADDARYKPEGEKPRGATAALIELDKDLMKLLVRRATLVSRIRGGKDHASTPGAIQAEKAVRTAFEANALSFSKDPKFTRQLFTLLQDLTVLSKDEAQSRPGFSLAPPYKPVNMSLAGPVSDRTACMWMALAACTGAGASLRTVPRSEVASACVHALSQAGGDLTWQEQKGPSSTLDVRAGAIPAFTGKTVYVGDDPLTLYLVCFLAARHVGITRLTGGSGLKSAELSGLRHTLPLLGARLAHVIPRSQGLPATLECSGMLPDAITVPEDLPLEGVCALLLAPLIWNVPVRVDLSALPAAVAATALTEISALFSECGAEVDSRGASLVYSPWTPQVPDNLRLPLAPLLSAYLLALPGFAGGSATLKGVWPSHLPEAQEVEQLLAWAGLNLDINGDQITSTPEASGKTLPPALMPEDPNPLLLPLMAALFARDLRQGKTLEDFPCDTASFSLAQSFFARLDIRLEDDGLHAAQSGSLEAAPAWTCPDAFWGMALALGSFVRSGQRLSNPDLVAGAMPSFWPIFNGLPEPKEPGSKAPAKEKSDARTARRRIIAD